MSVAREADGAAESHCVITTLFSDTGVWAEVCVWRHLVSWQVVNWKRRTWKPNSVFTDK